MYVQKRKTFVTLSVSIFNLFWMITSFQCQSTVIGYIIKSIYMPTVSAWIRRTYCTKQCTPATRRLFLCMVEMWKKKTYCFLACRQRINAHTYAASLPPLKVTQNRFHVFFTRIPCQLLRVVEFMLRQLYRHLYRGASVYFMHTLRLLPGRCKPSTNSIRCRNLVIDCDKKR